MKTILDLAFKNLKKYAREAALVILSILLTVSMMTMVASTMSSLYSSLMQHRIKSGQNFANATVHGVNNVKGFMDEIRDEISSYYIDGYEEMYRDIENDFYVYTNPYQACQLDDIEAWCLRNEIIEGRRSKNRYEIVVSIDSKYKVGDKLTLEHLAFNEQLEDVEVVVVGRSKSPGRNDFYVSEEEMSEKADELILFLIYKEGSKNIDKKLNKIIDSGKYTNYSMLVLNDDYNFFMGFQSKPGTLLYTTATITMIMLLLVGLVTISLILNAFEALISQQEKSIGTLRSIGMTKDQLKKMILIQGFSLSGIGIILGILLGVELGKVLISYVFENMNDMFMTLGGESNIEIFFDTSLWMYIITVLSGIIIIYLAQRKKLKELFSKSSIETLREHKLSNKKVKVNLSKNPINGLAKINTKMTRDFKGIQTALMISVVLLVGINGWTNSFMSAFESQIDYFDSYVEVFGSNEIDISEDKNKIINILNKYDEIEEIVQIDTIHSIILTENNKKGSIYDEDIVKEHDITFSFIYVRVLEDNYFKQVVKDNGLKADSETIFLNNASVQIDDEKVDGSLVDLSDTNTLELNDTVSNKDLNIEVDESIYEFSNKYSHLNNGPTVLVKKSYFDKNFDGIIKGAASIKIKSELSKDSIIKLQKELDNLIVDNHFYFYSNYFDSYVTLILNKTVFTITAAIFVYIALVILINVLNISLSTYKIRKQDIATLMSIGASQKQIEKMFFRESLLISFIPYIKGLGAGHLIAFLMIKITSVLSQEAFKYKISPSVMFMSLVLVLVIILVQYLSLVKENKKLDLISDIQSY